MRRYILACFLLAALALGGPTQALANDMPALTIYGEYNPPLTFAATEPKRGILPDILAETLNRAGFREGYEDFRIVPWPRAYKAVQKRKNSLLFPMVYTESRAPLFKWVGPVVTSNTVLLARKTDNIRVTGTKDLQNYIITAIHYDIGEVSLLENGVPRTNIFYVSAPKNAAQMLGHGRIKLWAYSRMLAYWQLSENGFDIENFEVVFTLKQGHRYFALHKETDDAVVKALQAAVDDMRREGIIEATINRYLPNSPLLNAY